MTTKGILFLFLSGASLAYSGEPRKQTPQELPLDLREKIVLLQSAVQPEAEQGEFRLSYQAYLADLENDYLIHDAVAALTLQELLGKPGYSLERFEKVAAVADNRFSAAFVSKRLFGTGTFTPFFCYSFMRLTDTSPFDQFLRDCRTESRNLLQGLLPTGADAALLDIRGEFYGQDERIIVVIKSATEKAKYLRIEFDLVHEI